MPRRYATAQAFRQALDARLREQSLREGIDLPRLQRRVAFERFLARLFADTDNKPPWVLKGGYSLELRLHEVARATIDLDLSVPTLNRVIHEREAQLSAIRELLQEAMERDLDDSFTFFLRTPDSPLQGPIYGGVRFSVEARQNNRTFASFHVDVALGDVIISSPDWITGHETLSFADIPPARIAALPVEQHFAEKIHSYTLPRGEAMNTRIKDLVDLVLLIDMGLPDEDVVRQAVRATFERRKTHNLPITLPDPPAEWRERYTAIASECGVSRQSMENAIEYVSAHWKSLHITDAT